MAVPWVWIVFGVIVVGLLVCETVGFLRRPSAMPLWVAGLWSAAWVGLAAIFAGAVCNYYGPQKAVEFVTGYVLEWSLSLDNLFVFLAIFTSFAVPEIARQRVLFWGILGAVILRGIFIAAGAALLSHFEWVLYVFGAFLVITGVKLLCRQDSGGEPRRHPVLRLVHRFVTVTSEYHAQRFFVHLGGHWVATPLVPVLIAIGTTDLLFATDSIPAIFGITRDPFIVYSSNLFAVLGLRGLFFLLAGAMKFFRYLKVGLSVVLVFVGTKMLAVDLYQIPAGTSLLVIGGVLSVSILASLLAPDRKRVWSRGVRGLPRENAAEPKPSGAEERA